MAAQHYLWGNLPEPTKLPTIQEQGCFTTSMIGLVVQVDTAEVADIGKDDVVVRSEMVGTSTQIYILFIRG